MNKQNFDFWQDHSERFLAMAFNADYQEIIHNPDGYGQKTGDCGDTAEIFLTGNNNGKISASYYIKGCLYTNACCNALVRLVRGKHAEEAWEITPEQVAEYLETLPEDHKHCAELAVGALYLALRDFQQKSDKTTSRQGSREQP